MEDENGSTSRVEYRLRKLGENYIFREYKLRRRSWTFGIRKGISTYVRILRIIEIILYAIKSYEICIFQDTRYVSTICYIVIYIVIFYLYICYILFYLLLYCYIYIYILLYILLYYISTYFIHYSMRCSFKFCSRNREKDFYYCLKPVLLLNVTRDYLCNSQCKVVRTHLVQSRLYLSDLSSNE